MPETVCPSGWRGGDVYLAPAGRGPGRAAAACMSQRQSAELRVYIPQVLAHRPYARREARGAD